MASTSLAHPAHPPTREARGLRLYEEHSDLIRFEDGIWYVPSQHDATSVYEVVIGLRGESCECADFEHRGQACKHIHAATIARSKTRRCVACRQSFPRSHVVEVHEDHESLVFYPGDTVCASSPSSTASSRGCYELAQERLTNAETGNRHGTELAE